MSASHAILVSLGVCALVAALEGACAGKDVNSYFATLQWPRYSPPLWIWYLIGLLYYAVFFFLLYRVLRLHNGSSLKPAVLALIVFMMVGNAFWNYIFFRARNLFVAFIGGSVAPVFDIALLVLVIQLDKAAAWSMLPYLLYRMYAVWWGYGLWKLNR